MSAEKMKVEKELSVEERLKALYELQSILSEIDRIKTLRGELPLEVQDLEDEVAGLNTRLENIKAEMEEIEASIAHRKIEASSAKEKIEKYKSQQENVTNNKEYDFLSKEIEFQTLEIELSEKKVKESNARMKEHKEEMEVVKRKIEERKSDLVAKRAELDEIVSETKIDEEKLRAKAKKIETTVESRLLTAFKRIRKNARNGLAVVYVQRDACGGCFNKIPPQRQLDIKMHKKIIVCEYCGRIMIDAELAGIE